MHRDIKTKEHTIDLSKIKIGRILLLQLLVNRVKTTQKLIK